MRRASPPTAAERGAALGPGLALKFSLALCLGLASSCGGAPAAPPFPAPEIAEVTDVLGEAGRVSIESATAAVSGAPDNAGHWKLLGARYEAYGLPAQAEIAYSGALFLEPDDARTAYRAAVTARDAGQAARAAAHLERVLELAPDYGPAWRRRGLWLLEDGDTDGARAAFSTAAAHLPNAPDAPLCLARTALLDDDIGEALAQAGLALRRAPDDDYVRLVLGTALRRAGRFDEAAPHLAAGQGSTPTFADPWTAAAQQDTGTDDELARRGETLEAEGRWDDAIAVYRDLLERRPDDGSVMLHLGVALTKAGRAQDATLHYDRAVQRFPGHYELCVGRAGALQAAERHAEAFQAIGEVIRRWPDRPQAYLVRGELNRATNDLETARADYARATALAPGDVRGRLFEGRVLLQMQRWSEAERVLAEGLEVSGARPPLAYYRLLLQAQVRSNADPAAVTATLASAREVHGDAADSLTRKRR